MLRVYNCLVEQHDLGLVLLAAVLCAIAARATFVLLHLAATSSALPRARWALVAAFATGVGTWATHFIAMLAFEPGVAAGYQPQLTLLSLAVPVAANIVAFTLALSGPAPWRRWAGGTLVGLGIAAMHHTGMAAYELSGILLWDRPMLTASLLLGVPLVALSIALGLVRDTRGGRLLAAGLLTLGICVIHFVGMSAVIVLPDAAARTPEGLATPAELAVWVGIGAALVLLLSLGSAALTRRDRRRDLDEAERLRALADAAVEGLLVCRGDVVVSSNRSAQRLLGHAPAWFAGRPLGELLQDPRELPLLLGADDTPKEVELRAADGSAIPVEAIARPLAYGGAPHRVLALRDLRDRRQAESQIRFLAHNDALTGLPNRVAFAERLSRALENHIRTREPFAVLALDLDRFKMVNDTLGHAVGDLLLVKAARRLRAAVRQTDAISRLGGDEFAIVQFGGGQPQAATALAERLVELLSRPFMVDGQLLNIGASVGVSLFPGDGEDASTLARNADLALYRAKSEGRGGYRFFEPEMDMRMQQRRTLEMELRGALASRQFRLLYQPQLDLARGEIVGFEALLRWAHPDRGLVSPGAFVPLAEETGLIVPIGEWVLREACREAAGWERPVTIAVNLSPIQFQSPGLVDAVRSACAGAGLDPCRLELEITESVLLGDNPATLATLQELKALGVRISMDDFGTGYSSLSYLRSFPFDKIKIDRSFVNDITANHEAAAIIRAIIGLGRSLGMQTTVEGVETDAQLDHVRGEGCDQVQGYLVGRPLGAAAAREMLRQPAAA